MRQLIKKVLIEVNSKLPKPFWYLFRMTRGEKRVFDNLVKKSRNYVEFGMGGSTFRVLMKSQANVYSVDSSTGWISFMRQYSFIRRMEKERLKLFHVEIGITGVWGHPDEAGDNSLFPKYSSSIFDLVDKSKIDTVLIDGRFRVACALKTILECFGNENLTIMIHDFDRQYYQIVLKYLDKVSLTDTLVLLTLKDGIDVNEVRKDYEHYKFVAD